MGTWNTVGVSYNKVTGNMGIFLNDEYNSRQVVNQEIPFSDSLIIGGDGGATDMFKGRISCVRYFDVALTKGQMRDFRNCELREY